jgi:hypothetical protein
MSVPEVEQLPGRSLLGRISEHNEDQFSLFDIGSPARQYLPYLSS